MRRVCFFVLILVTFSVSAQEHQHSDHATTEELGEVSFPISCKPASQVGFNRAIALLHDFWYAEAEKAFNTIASEDADCSMALWGVAMSNYHPIWAPPNETEMKNGQTAAFKALDMGAKTDREKAYIHAIATFYKDSGKLDHKTRAKAYMQEMEKVHRQNPDDLEAAIFYSLSLLGTADISSSSPKRTSARFAAAISPVLAEPIPTA